MAAMMAIEIGTLEGSGVSDDIKLILANNSGPNIINHMSNTTQTQEAARQRLLDCLSGRYQTDLRARFMAAAKGLTAHQTACAMNRADSGHDYRGCSKGDMAEALCYREDYVVEAALAALRGAVRS